ncbi:MAG TPA: DegT/DnrJ/EryC1/StrS aminotransferase family protein [Gemmatimonadales bacterium]|nr:DegT/DnrJ/EryC1/StrS aminotransferase family protein [Gemmatimonadales bacterium]
MSPETSAPGLFLPFAAPDITEAEIDAVTAVLRSGWITTGAEVRAFEGEFAEYVGARYAVAVNSCTAALHLGLEALGIRAGDEVLTSTLTFTATAEVAEYLGARARFLDVEPDTLNLSPAILRAAVERDYVRSGGSWRHRTSGGRLGGILPVHYGGHPCDMEDMLALAHELEIPVLDDAAHALPAAVRDTRIGGFPCPTAFSFYATKTITTGEGGMLCTSDPDVADRARLMALHGISRDAWNRYGSDGKWHYEVLEAGYKYNLTDIAAALGRVQLSRAETMLARRREIARRYDAAFADLDTLVLPAQRPHVQHAWHLYPLRLRLDRLSIDRSGFIGELRKRQIGASVHFIPLHRQPFYRERYGYRPEEFPVAEATYPTLVSLPIYSVMSDEDVERVVAAVTEISGCFAA